MKNLLLMEVPQTQVIKQIEDNLEHFVRDYLYEIVFYNSRGNLCRFSFQKSNILHALHAELLQEFPEFADMERGEPLFKYGAIPPDEWPELIKIKLSYIQNLSSMRKSGILRRYYRDLGRKYKENNTDQLEFINNCLLTSYCCILQIEKDGFEDEIYFIEISLIGVAFLENGMLCFKILTKDFTDLARTTAIQIKDACNSAVEFYPIIKTNAILNYFNESFDPKKSSYDLIILEWPKIAASAQFQNIDLTPLFRIAHEKVKKSSEEIYQKALKELTRETAQLRSNGRELIRYLDEELPEFIEAILKQLETKNPTEINPFEIGMKILEKYR